MARYEDPKLTVSLDDESKELLRALVKAVDKLAPQELTDVSFGDAILPKSERTLKRLIEPNPPVMMDGRVIKGIQYGGRRYDLIESTAGDYLLHDDEHEGEELE